MKIEILGHCQFAEITKTELLRNCSGITNKKNLELLKTKMNDNGVVVIGDTQIAGYLLVLQYLTKKYNGLTVAFVSNNLAVYNYKSN
uniref:Uncharacterized protein n=1 Tax=viral metagenome TaxID=1070528 RepID=A0A6M3MD89_9ZZZZ